MMLLDGRWRVYCALLMASIFEERCQWVDNVWIFLRRCELLQTAVVVDASHVGACGKNVIRDETLVKLKCTVNL